MSASSLLLTVLGEFVLPTGGSAWTSSLIRSLDLVDVSERSTRQAILRAGRQGWLETERVGRQARCRLTDDGDRLLSEGAARIYHFGRDQAAWDGEWLLVITSADPTSEANHRQRLRTRLAWCGLAPLAPGVWVSPDPGREKQVVEELDRLGLTARTFVGHPGELAIDAEAVSSLWDLGQLADDYHQFLDRFPPPTGQADPSDEEAARDLIHLVEAWRRFPLLDPELPVDLLPDDWPGAAATTRFTQLRTLWSTPAHSWWTTLEVLR